MKKNIQNNNKNHKIKNVSEIKKNKDKRVKEPTSARHKPAAFKLDVPHLRLYQRTKQTDTKFLVMIRKMQNFSLDLL